MHKPHSAILSVSGQAGFRPHGRFLQVLLGTERLTRQLLSDMKTVTLRSLRREVALLDSAAAGEELLVTRFGRPYVRIVAAVKSRTFVGAGRRLRVKEPVTPEPIPESEWKGMR
jgi:antitoxin (DNA-binding transcriptional repressor) of toxin-antitoxin stability system